MLKDRGVPCFLIFGGLRALSLPRPWSTQPASTCGARALEAARPPQPHGPLPLRMRTSLGALTLPATVQRCSAMLLMPAAFAACCVLQGFSIQ